MRKYYKPSPLLDRDVIPTLVPAAFPKKYVDEEAVGELIKGRTKTLDVNSIKKFVNVLAERHERFAGAVF